jgi:beta-lactamase class A
LIVKGKINPAQKLTYQKQFYEGGTGSIQYKKVGTTFTIKELSKLSITVSDNIATNMLISKLGRANVASYMKSLVNHSVDASKNISSPKDMSIYLTELLDFQKEHPTEGDEMIYNLEHTVFNDRIPKLLPKEVKVAHKIGTQVRAIHDVGIVYADRPYIICIMSKDVDEKKAPEVLAKISKMIYDYSQK